MANTAENLYKSAYKLHYTDHDPDMAIELYRQVIEIFPDSQESQYAKSQIANLECDPNVEKWRQMVEPVREKRAIQEKHIEGLNELRTSASLSIKDIIGSHCGELIGINALDPSKITTAKLLEVQGDHFNVELNGLVVHIPYSQIIRISTSPYGLVSAGVFEGQYSLVIKVFDFVIYKGALGLSMPIG